MNKIYVFYGEEDFLINKAILSVCHKHSDGQVIKYDLSKTNISDLVEDALMGSIFGEKKIIIGYNAIFLSSDSTKETINHNIETFINYIDHSNPDTIIILVLESDKLDKRKNIVKKLLATTEIKEFVKLNQNDMVKYAKDVFDKAHYQITFKALNMLVEMSGASLYLINSECEKLMHYKLDNQIISEEDITEMIVKYDFDNVFALTDAVIKKDIDNSLFLYQELLKRNEEPIKIIVMLANQFRLIFQVKRMLAKGINESEIATDLGVHPYRVKLASQVKLSEEKLLSYMNALADLDEGIKMGKVNKDVGLELFLLKL